MSTQRRGTAAPAAQNIQVVGGAVAAPVPANALALPADLEWAREHGSHFDTSEMVIPFLRVLQSNSPQIERNAPEYIPGAVAGTLCNVATGELFDGEAGLVVVPVKYQRDVTEWHPRESGGGLVANHGPDLTQLERLGEPDAKGKRVTAEGTEIVDSALYYCIAARDDGTLSQVVVAMSSTGWRAARKWNTRMQTLLVTDSNGKQIPNPPIFLGAWRLRSQYETNDKCSWYAWGTPEFAGFTPAHPRGGDILVEVRKLLDGIKDGRVKIDPNEMREPNSGTTTGAPVDAADVPF